MENEILIECVPNFSEGQRPEVIDQIVRAIASVVGVQVLHTDPGYSANRTVVTFVGPPQEVMEAAFRGIAKAAELIDMRKHKGTHPRMGATDVCPLVPIKGISLKAVAVLAEELGRRVGKELKIPVYLYEAAAQQINRSNLATIRAGEYEGLAEKMKNADWQPDFGPETFQPVVGATVIGARPFLAAYNINLNTTSVKLANAVAFDVRERGRLLRQDGEVVLDEDARPIRVPGRCKGVKAIGWYIEEFGQAQVSMNITQLDQTSLHEAFEACREAAAERGLRVTGSELVGMIPKAQLLKAGKYFLRKQKRSSGIAEKEIINIAVKSLGLDQLAPFKPEEKVLEYRMAADNPGQMEQWPLEKLGDRISGEDISMAGGVATNAIAVMAAALAVKLSNLCCEKYLNDPQTWAFFVEKTEIAQGMKIDFQALMEEDRQAYAAVLKAKTTADKQAALKRAIESPRKTLLLSFESMHLLNSLVEELPLAALPDLEVAASHMLSVHKSAGINMHANARLLTDKSYGMEVRLQADALRQQAESVEWKILEVIKKRRK